MFQGLYDIIISQPTTKLVFFFWGGRHLSEFSLPLIYDCQVLVA
jgi:hypothetical protein